MSEIKDFSLVVRGLEDGQFNTDASEELSKIIKALRNQILTTGAKKAKAEMTIKFEIVLDSGNVIISSKMDTKLPMKPRGSSVFWATKDNGLSTENPKQPSLPFTAYSGGRAEVVDLTTKKEDEIQ